MKSSVKDFSSKCDEIRSFLWIWLHLLKNALMEKFIFCALIPLYHFAHLDSDFYLQLCIWDDYHVFFNYTARNYQTAYSMTFTNLVNYHLGDWWSNVNFYFFSRDVTLGFD